MRKRNIAIGVCLLIIGLVTTNITLSAKISTMGMYVNDLEVEYQMLAKQNVALERAMLEHGSLHLLQAKADDLGFTQPVTLSSVTTGKEVAYFQ